MARRPGEVMRAGVGLVRWSSGTGGGAGCVWAAAQGGHSGIQACRHPCLLALASPSQPLAVLCSNTGHMAVLLLVEEGSRRLL